MGRYRVTIKEAAKRLGVKDEAIRKRIRRNTIKSEKDAESGRVYVYIDEPPVEDYGAGHDEDNYALYPADYDTLIRSQQEQIEFLRRELERKDAILLNMIEATKAFAPAAEIPPGPREPQELSEARQSTSSPEEERPENSDLVKLLEQLENWLQTRAREA